MADGRSGIWIMGFVRCSGGGIFSSGSLYNCVAGPLPGALAGVGLHWRAGAGQCWGSCCPALCLSGIPFGDGARDLYAVGAGTGEFWTRV